MRCLIPWYLQDQDSHQDAQEISSYDSLDLSSLPSTPTEDDLLRMDMSELESMPSSELYLGGPEPVTALATLPRRVSAVKLDISSAKVTNLPRF